METNEKVTGAAEETRNELVNTDMSEHKDQVDINCTTDTVVLDVIGESEADELVSTAKDYSVLSREELVMELTAILGSSDLNYARKDVEVIKNCFYKLQSQFEVESVEQETVAIAEVNAEVEAEDDIEQTEAAKTTAEIVEPEVDKLEQQFKKLLTSYRNKRIEAAKRLEEVKEQNYKLKLQLIEEIKVLTGEEENLNHTFQKFHDIQNRWREVGTVPQSYAKDLLESYHHNVEKFYDYVKINKELRDLDLKRNLEAKLELIRKAEALLDETSVNEAFQQLQVLHNTWREIGPVPRDQKDSVWDTFKEITSQINKKHQAYFEQRKEEQQRNLALKLELCERAEKLGESTPASVKDWQKYTDELTQMLEDWKLIGFVPKKENADIYARFKAARDAFFQKRKDFYKESKQEIQTNLKKKKALCEQAEELMDSELWKQSTDALIALQKQWKTVGPVPRKISDDLWKRFRAACDNFFNRKAEYFSEKDSQYLGNLEVKCELIKEVENFILGDDREANFTALKNMQQRWREIGFVPMKDKDRIHKEFQEAIDKKFKSLRVSDDERNVMRFKDKIDSIQSMGSHAKSDRAFRNERDKLYSKIVHIEGDIQLWENNIGFFAKSKNADTMIADVKRKIENAKDEIKVLEEKIKLIDLQYKE